MRKIAALLLSALIGTATLLPLTGCGKETPPPSQTTTQLSQGFSAKADLTYGDISATADINRTSDGAVTVVLNSPSVLKGMTFTYRGETIHVSYLGMSVDLSEDGFAAKAMATAVVNAVNSAMKGTGITVKMKGNTAELSGENDSGKFALTMDKKTGAILKISIPSLELECNFSDYKAS